MRKGFALLISVLIISAALCALVWNAGSLALQERLSAVEIERAEDGAQLAEACQEVARLKFSQNVNYAGNETAVVAGISCAISNAGFFQGALHAHVRAQSGKISAERDVSFDPNSFSVIFLP